jgi:hypothetical protein
MSIETSIDIDGSQLDVKIETYGKFYYLNEKLHRLDGAAAEWSNGDREYYKNGYRHRLNGAAIEWHSDKKYFWYEGKYIKCESQEEFERILKLKLFW